MLRALCLLAVLAAARACKPCTCGVARRARVVGGGALQPGEFPWLAALRRDGKVICGATVVARDHLVTATHCIFEIEASRLSVLVGEYDVNSTRSAGLAVAHVFQHPDFNRYTYDNDIAVLRLAEPLPDHLYRPACLPNDDSSLDGVNAVVSGWGGTVEKGPPSNIPMKAEVNIWSEEECKGAGYGRRKVTPRMICANAPDRDSCTGDSGGPLLMTQPYHTLVGIVSWGRGCARQGYPGVYVRVDRFMPWLQVALRHACTCSPPSSS
ncbi:transmembrane protease serine 9-like [Aricia agestis]|uniref:transmembrane protease serine 9-like n=1 Tax=Aricia agestis TaxID=91739 RepID=UPI001C201964|nr:transmembrane protease serine 9-like [Aricia agestis]